MATTRLEPYVNHRAPNPPKTPRIAELGWNGKYNNSALATVPQQPNFQMGETPEFRAAQAAKPKIDLSGYKPPPVNQATGVYTGPAASPTAPAVPPTSQTMPKPAGVISKLNGTIPRSLAGAGTALGVGIEGAKVAQTATAPASTGYDIAEQVAESSGRLAAAGLGAKAGAALGAFGGPAAPITVPVGAVLGGAAGYFGAGKIASLGREAIGVDGREAVDRVAPSTAQATPAPVKPIISSIAGAGRGVVNPSISAPTIQKPEQTSQSAEAQPGVFRVGNSFSDSASGASAGAKAAPISAQNMAAADALAARYQSPISQMAAPQQPAQSFIPQDTGGYGLLDKAARQQRSLMMDAQQAKPGARTALRSFLKQQEDAPGQQIDRERLAQGAQESAADRMARREEFGAKLGESAADRALRSQELADNSLTNQVKRDAMGVESGAAKQMAALRSQYLDAKTPEEAAAAAAKINALSGKGTQQDEYMAVSSGQSVDPATGMVTKSPDIIVNKRTGQPVTGQQAKPAAALPAGMTRQVGTSGGKPVYEDASGKRFLGG